MDQYYIIDWSKYKYAERGKGKADFSEHSRHLEYVSSENKVFWKMK
jgi:hypothetical protein